MYTTQEGYKVTVFNTERNKQYNFTKLGAKSYIDNELKDLGFSTSDIAAATYVSLAPEELKQHVKALECALG